VRGIVDEVLVHGGAGDVLAVLDAVLVREGVVRELERAALVVGAEARVEALFGPGAADTGVLVEDDEVGVRRALEVGFGCGEAGEA
jgi:hypothetical protein